MKPPAARDPRRSALFENIWSATLAQHERGETPAAFEDARNQFEATLVARADFPPAVLDALGRLLSGAAAAGPHLAAMPAQVLHITLFPLYVDKPQEFFDAGTPERRARDYARLLDVWRRFRPIRLRLEGLNLTPQGVVTVQGFDADGKMDDFREAARAALPDPVRRASESIHVTLARPFRKPDLAEQGRLIDWVSSRRAEAVGMFAVNDPVIRLTCDRQGAIPHAAGESETSGASRPA